MKNRVIIGLFICISTTGLFITTSIDWDTQSLIKLSNIEALAQEEDGKYPRYKNVTDKSSTVEFRTEITSKGVKVEYKRECSAYTTYCKNTGDEKDICYKELNGVENTCDNWEEK